MPRSIKGSCACGYEDSLAKDSVLQMGSTPKEDKDFILKNMVEFAQSLARPTTKFVVNALTDSVGKDFTSFMHCNRAFIAVEILERVRQAEAHGFDAAFAGTCHGEFYLKEARQTVRMPVVGPSESAMMVAQLLGERFAVVTVADVFIPVVEDTIRSHGSESRAIRQRPVRAWTPDTNPMLVDAYSGRPDRLIEEFERLALECVRDGADVVICGCNSYGAGLAKVGYTEVGDTGVPVVAALPAMIKIAEAMVDLRRTLGMTQVGGGHEPLQQHPA